MLNFLFLIIFSIAEASYRIPPISESHIIFGSTFENHIKPKSVKILVWNILKSKRKNWELDFFKISQDTDILILQEAYLNTTCLEFYKNVMYLFRFDMAVSFLNRYAYPTGTMVGSKINPVDSGIIRTSYLEPIIKTPKTATYTFYHVENYEKNLLVVSIHSLNLAKDIFFKKQLNDIFEVIKNHDGPIIFAGDFNTRNKNRTNFLKIKMKENYFEEVVFLKDKRTKFLVYPLDYVFIKDLVVKNSKVLDKIKSSDHKPLYVEVYLK